MKKLIFILLTICCISVQAQSKKVVMTMEITIQSDNQCKLDTTKVIKNIKKDTLSKVVLVKINALIASKSNDSIIKSSYYDFK